MVVFDDRTEMEVLDRATCCDLLRSEVVGRVAFSDASLPSMLERPTTAPAQPQTTKEQYLSSTGKVVVQKKSMPLTRLPSSATS